MRKNICAKVDEELPLYAGGDLPARRARRVAEHVRGCARCTTSAEEWRAAREDLKLFAAPAFEERIFSDIRAAVLRELATNAPGPTPYPVFSWWGKHQWPAFAAALALLILPVTLIRLLPGRSPAPVKSESAAPVGSPAAPPRPEQPPVIGGGQTAQTELRATRVAVRHTARPSAPPRRDRQRALLDSVSASSTGAVPAYQLISPALPAAPVAASDIDGRVLEPVRWGDEQKTNNSQVITISVPLPQFE